MDFPTFSGCCPLSHRVDMKLECCEEERKKHYIIIVWSSMTHSKSHYTWINHFIAVNTFFWELNGFMFEIRIMYQTILIESLLKYALKILLLSLTVAHSLILFFSPVRYIIKSFLCVKTSLILEKYLLRFAKRPYGHLDR